MSELMKKQKFPCHSCKGQGEHVEDYIDGWPVAYGCYVCGSEGMVEPGGEYHQKIVVGRIMRDLWSLCPYQPMKEDEEQYVGLIREAGDLIESLVSKAVAEAARPDVYRVMSWKTND